MLYTHPAITVFDNTIIEDHLADRIHILGTDLDRTTAGSHGAIGHGDILAFPKVRILPPVLQADTIIPAFDITITDPDIAAVIDINAITITHFQAVQETDPGDHHIITTDEVDGPVSGVADMQIMYTDILSADDREHMRTRIADIEGL